jgi:ATP-dependent Clp protease ATP-binding subunit ClpA
LQRLVRSVGLLQHVGHLRSTGDGANLLEPALVRGKLRTSAATTWAEYKKYFEPTRR